MWILCGTPGSRNRGALTRLRPRFRRTLANMTSRRSVVDYGLARRATLASVYSGHTTVADVCGDELGQYEGRVKKTRELAEMAAEYGEFRVYIVEVCQSCGWNHLASSYVLGTGEPAVRRRRRERTSQ